MMQKLIFLCVMCVVHALANSDDRFIKKYAMMKIYESCFGPEVVKQIRKEMKDAYTKCSAPPSFEETPNSHVPPIFLGKLPPGFLMDPNTQTITKPTDGAQQPDHDNNLQDQAPGQHPQKGGPGNIFAFRPQAGYPQQQQQPIPPYMMPTSPQFRPFSAPTPFYQFPYSAPGLFYPPGPQYNPYAYQQQPFYQQPMQQYFGASNRMSRDMDLRDRLEVISRGPAAGRVRNITCVMQELGYIDHNLEPNYEQITQRIANLPVSVELKGDIQDGLQFCQKFSELGYIDHNLEPNYEQITQRIANLPVSVELKGDIQDGLQFCQKFSQCVPDVKRDVAPLSQELIKPMFFFRCYKHKKLEACIMKDIRERFTSEDELDTDTDFRSLSRSARSIREDLNDPRFEALDEMAVYLYDYLSGGNGFDFDLYM